MDGSSIIVLLARQRSGTNALRSILNTHPDIYCFPEVFHNNPRRKVAVQANYFNFLARHLDGDAAGVLKTHDHEGLFLDFLEYLRCFTPKRFIVIDVKYMSTHHVAKAWRFIGEEPYLFFLIREHGLRVLNMQRKNYLRYCLSEIKAQVAQRWAIPKDAAGERVDQTVYVDVDWMLRVMELCRSEDEAVTRAFAAYEPLLQLEYEEFFPEIDGPVSDAPLERIADWLGVEPAFGRRQPFFRKQSILPLEQTIENYPEVAEALRGTDFEYCLEDEQTYQKAVGHR